jgi:hypothetical protein
MRLFNIDEHVNGVADAIIKLGGVDKAAEILDEVWLEVQFWIERGYVPARLAEKIHYKTGVPMYELVQERGR